MADAQMLIITRHSRLLCLILRQEAVGIRQCGVLAAVSSKTACVEPPQGLMHV